MTLGLQIIQFLEEMLCLSINHYHLYSLQDLSVRVVEADMHFCWRLICARASPSHVHIFSFVVQMLHPLEIENTDYDSRSHVPILLYSPLPAIANATCSY